MKHFRHTSSLTHTLIKPLSGLLALGVLQQYRHRREEVITPHTKVVLKNTTQIQTDPEPDLRIVADPQPAAWSQPVQVPTLYVHGFRGGDYTTNKMVLSAQNALHSETYLKVLVDWHGRLTYQGSWSDDPNPLVQIVFEDKWMPTLQIVNWLSVVLPQLQQKFHFSAYNAVGHSIGATALVRVEMRHHAQPNFPKLNKLVLVAGPFDGVVAFGDWPNLNRLNQKGRPMLMNFHYLQLMMGRHHFSSEASVLNIYGNVDDATNTDKYISVNSAKSIRYILAPVVKAFHEIEVHGQNAEHSKMHDDDHVLNLINEFLFANPQ